MRVPKYILGADGEPVREDNLEIWAPWIQGADLRVAQTVFPDDGEHKEVRVCTDFLGLDYNFNQDGPPILWETMVFGDPEAIDHLQVRCAGSREQAEGMGSGLL